MHLHNKCQLCPCEHTAKVRPCDLKLNFYPSPNYKCGCDNYKRRESIIKNTQIFTTTTHIVIRLYFHLQRYWCQCDLHDIDFFAFSSGKIICLCCKKKCSGEVLRVQDKYFHISCFKCKGRKSISKNLANAN